MEGIWETKVSFDMDTWSMMENVGWFVAIVGPSGAGKDTVINTVHEILVNNEAFLFTRRIITRKSGVSQQNENPKKLGNEDNMEVSVAKFLKLLDQGAFAMHWFAHGIYYGLPADIKNDVKQGKIVIANISRECLGMASKLFDHVFVVEINAPVQILKERLINRKREEKSDIAERLGRANVSIHLPERAEYSYIDNSGDVKIAVGKLLAILENLAGQKPRSITEKR